MVNETIIEDNDLIVLAPKRAFVQGQLVIIPKSNPVILEQVSDDIIKKVFQVANKMSSTLFESTGCQGTNIIIQNGVAAGQINEVFSVNIIPRTENDNLKLEWEPKQASPEDLELSLKSFKSVKEQETQNKIIEEKKKIIEQKKEEIMKPDEHNYLIKSMSRQP